MAMTGIKRSIAMLISHRGTGKNAVGEPGPAMTIEPSKLPPGGKTITVFHVDSYGLDAYVFQGYDERMIEDTKETVGVRFYVLNDGYRAFTAPCCIAQFMFEEFEHYKYEVIDRRGKTCPGENWGE